MDILNIIQCTNLGGMEQSNLLLLRGLKIRGHSIRLVSLNPLGGLSPRLEEEGIPSLGLEYRGRFGWQSMPAMRRAFSTPPPDAVLMTGHNITAMLVLARLMPIRRVLAIHYHHFERPGDYRRWKLFYGFATKIFSHITFASALIRDEALSISPNLEKVSYVVPNPFEVGRVPRADEKARARASLGIFPGTKVVGNAGWLIPRKRFDVFLYVASEILIHQPDTVFLIAGDGPEKDGLLGLARDLGIDQRVIFTGWQADLNNFYSSLDVMLFNTDFDALGRTPAEAAACGVPVVASVIHGGLPELFRSHDEAIIFREHDIHGLAQSVVNLLSNPDYHDALAKRGRARVAEYGDLERHAATMEMLLES
ncbi:glycosyltransferase [Ectothiorhodospira shaposhnikovii]|uniref:glycosyltransferase n=1 Tax=Ectothiorhodospira shaposhnikovii TaxID=1054 RepID=UPI0039A0C4D8